MNEHGTFSEYIHSLVISRSIYVTALIESKSRWLDQGQLKAGMEDLKKALQNSGKEVKFFIQLDKKFKSHTWSNATEKWLSGLHHIHLGPGKLPQLHLIPPGLQGEAPNYSKEHQREQCSIKQTFGDWSLPLLIASVDDTSGHAWPGSDESVKDMFQSCCHTPWDDLL